ncbi:MAG: hypothetical protein EOM20_15865 [Spartobacteria bacterium]|nr:hypothetical protein [Spartobacteria bacterium]
MKKWIIGLGLALAWPGVVGCAAEREATSLDFVFFTDVHARPQWDTPEALRKAARVINDCHPAFVIAGGDLITDGFQAAVGTTGPFWDAYMHLHNGITSPVHVVMGNHDLVGARPSDGSPPAGDPRALFGETFGLEQTYRSFDTGGYHFILLNSPQLTTANPYGYEGRIDSAQLAWLKEDLRQVAPETPIILVTHFPLLTAFYQAVDGADTIPVRGMVMNNDEVLELFARHHLLLVLQGHTHAFEAIQWRGSWFLTGGAICAKWWRGPWLGTEEGFLNIRLRGDTVTWNYIDYGWDARRPPDQ